MSRKTFILIGLFLIALGPLSVALQSYLLLSKIIPTGSGPYYLLFGFLVTPIGFGLLLWKWQRTVGRSRRFTVLSIFGLLVTYYLSFVILPVHTWIGLDISSVLLNEVGDWAKSGRDEVIIFTMKAKLQVALMLIIGNTIGMWSLFLALYLGASDPRFPKGNNLLGRLSKRVSAMRRATSRPVEQTVS